MSISGRVRLLRHPQSTGAPALEIGVDVARETSTLLLMYTVWGDIAAVALPKQTAATRTDGLWKHTCFEAFLRSAQAADYWEFNFSPSREWAAYRFNGYRQGMESEHGGADPHIEMQVEGSALRLSATVDLSGFAALASSDDWRLGLSAIIEDETGGKSWWALAHPSGKPDFHHPDSFVLALPRGENG